MPLMAMVIVGQGYGLSKANYWQLVASPLLCSRDGFNMNLPPGKNEPIITKQR